MTDISDGEDKTSGLPGETGEDEGNTESRPSKHTQLDEPPAGEQEFSQNNPTNQRSETKSSSGRAGIALGGAALLVALGALGVALWPKAEVDDVEISAVFTDEEVAAARDNTCRAVELARTAIGLRSSAATNEVTDPVAAEVLAASVRGALSAAGPYLLNNVVLATPPELADEVTKFADHASEAGMAAWAGSGTDEPLLAEPLGKLAESDAKIGAMCNDAQPGEEESNPAPEEAPDANTDVPPPAEPGAPAEAPPETPAP